MRGLWLVLWVFLCAFTSLCGGLGRAQAEPLKIRIGWSSMPAQMIPVLYSKPELLKYYGRSYVVEPVKFRAASANIIALAAEEVDLAVLSPFVLNEAVLNARQDVKVLADVVQDGVGDQYSEAFLVRKDSRIATIADLKGKRIGAAPSGSTLETALRIMLTKNGLVAKRDYTLVETNDVSMAALLEEGKIDIGPVLMPLTDQMLSTGKYEVLFRAKDALSASQYLFLAGRSAFVDKNRSKLNDFFEDHVRAMRWFMDPANRNEALQLIGAYIKQPPERLSYLFTKADAYRDPFLVPNGRTLQDTLTVIKEAGLVPAIIQVEPKYMDTSFVEEAKRRIEAKK
jgi:NitT/TauT family transport system substrate-binding protein